MTDAAATPSRAATIAFYGAAVLLPALFLVRILVRPDVDAPAPDWLTAVTWLSIALAVGIFALGIVGYLQTQKGERAGFLRSGIAIALAFGFLLLSVPEVFVHSGVVIID
jgi:cytochrome bd-type quinol oxidase subunit 2